MFRVLGNTAIAALALAPLAAAQAQGDANVVRYSCAGNQQLLVQRHGSKAHVSLAGHGYDLERRHSSIGDKYLSHDAALIIDGPSAVFVSEHSLDLGACSAGVPLASAQ